MALLREICYRWNLLCFCYLIHFMFKKTSIPCRTIYKPYNNLCMYRKHICVPNFEFVLITSKWNLYCKDIFIVSLILSPDFWSHDHDVLESTWNYNIIWRTLALFWVLSHVQQYLSTIDAIGYFLNNTLCTMAAYD